MDQLISDAVFAVVGAQTGLCSVYASETAARRVVARFNADPFTEPGTPDPDAPYRVEARTRASIGAWHVRSDAEAEAHERQLAPPLAASPSPANRDAVSKLLIASTDLADAAFHFGNAVKRVREALDATADGSAAAYDVETLRNALDRMRPLGLEDLRCELHKVAVRLWPTVLTEEVP